MDDNQYYEKYLKYKTKYLNAKNMVGGIIKSSSPSKINTKTQNIIKKPVIKHLGIKTPQVKTQEIKISEVKRAELKRPEVKNQVVKEQSMISDNKQDKLIIPEEKINNFLKQNLIEIVKQIIIISLEMDCCLADTAKIKSQNSKQNDFLQQRYKLFKDFYADVNKNIMDIIKSKQNEIITQPSQKEMGKILMKNTYDVTINNYEDKLRYYWPIIENIFNKYILYNENLKKYIEENDIPYYSISTKSYKRDVQNIITDGTIEKVGLSCSNFIMKKEDKKETVKCCTPGVRPGECIDLLGAQQLSRITLLFNEIKKYLTDKNIGEIKNNINEKSKFLVDKTSQINKIFGEYENMNKIILTKYGEKQITQEFGELEDYRKFIIK